MFIPKSVTFKDLRQELISEIVTREWVDNDRWQGVDVSRDPSARMREIRNVVFEIPLKGIEDLDHWRVDCGPNLPWADDHFLERVGGEPLNPGVQWEKWPWASSADRHRGPDYRFNHTYMERLWPRWARTERTGEGRSGIGHRYGDLNDLVRLLVKDPFTRQAWIPLFFPEDTGVGDGGRKPCTLGYQFIRRGSGLHLWYPLRSCDLVRHFADDCYLAVRLMLWVLNRCRESDPNRWNNVGPDTFAMHLTSLHCFVNDLPRLEVN